MSESDYLSSEVRQERIQAALRLSGQLDKNGQPLPGADPHILIPRRRVVLRKDQSGERVISEGEYYVDSELQQKFLRMRRALARSKRFFILHGPPGSGKDTFMEEVAAGSEMPYRFFNLGGNTDLNQIKGGDGIAPETVYRSHVEPALHPGGEPLLGEHGESLLESKKELLGAVPRTTEILGEVVRWMREPSVIVLQEPEGQQEDMVQFHSALGDRLGSSSGRKIFIDSAHGQVHDVHPDCIVAVTHNARRRSEDFAPATKDRAVHFSFDYPPPEIEAERMARACTAVMSAAKDLYPDLCRQYRGEDLLPWARALSVLRGDLEGRPGADSLGFRTAVDAFCEMVQASHEGSAESLGALFDALEFLYIGEFLSREDRIDHIATMLSDYETILTEHSRRLARV